MQQLFLTFLEISAASAVVILIITLSSSFINRNYTVKWKYWLWMVLAVRLLIPWNFSFESAPARVEVSIPAAPITLPAAPVVPTAPVQPADHLSAQTAAPAAPAITTVDLLMLVWLIGAILFLLWQVVSYLRFRRQVIRWGRPLPKESAITSARQQAEAELEIGKAIPTLVCKEINSPMMIGFFRPLLILPHVKYSDQDLSYILRHELTHYKRRDIWYKALMLIACAVHWFNPAVWLMVREASRDLEISCDAVVMRGAGMEERRQYSQTILDCIHRELRVKTALSTHFYGGKKTLKERFANILNTKKRRTGAIAFVMVLLCGGIVGGLVACSMQDEPPTDEQIITLLQKAEAICQPGNTEVLSISQHEVMIGDLYYDEITGYEDAVAEVFTAAGTTQMEQAQLLDSPLILRQDGKVYRASAMTDSTATVYYDDIQSIELVEKRDGRFFYDIHHVSQPRWGEGEAMTSLLILVKADGRYQIESFIYPLLPEQAAGDFLQQALNRGLTAEQVEALINSSFTEEEILTLPIEELQSVFDRFAALRNTDENGFAHIDYVELLSMADNDHAYVSAGQQYLGWTVTSANAVGIPYGSYLLEAESIEVAMSGQAEVTGTIRRESDVVILTVSESSAPFVPTTSTSHSREITLHTTQEAQQLLTSMENGDTVRATISDYTISYSSDLSYDQNGDPLVENPKSLQQATLVAVLPDGAASEESFVVDVPENQIRMALDNLFPTLPENVAIEGNVLYDTENAIVMAELTAVESIEDPSDPFFHYDQLYAEAVRIEEGNWGGYSGKWYWLQEEITGEAVGGFENHIVYCIQAEESMILITFHPVRGIGGIGPQREAFEEILDTIRRENG